MPAAPQIEIVTMDDLEEILQRAASGSLTESDCERLRTAIGTLGWLTDELEAKRVSVARLKKLLFGQESEKTAEVFPEDDTVDAPAPGSSSTDDSTAGDPSAVDPAGDAEETNEDEGPRGHGRNGADDYEGAEKTKIEHETLKPGDPCPECSGGKVYRFTPKRLLRIRGQAPIHAELYEVESLRCNLCLTIFSAQIPEEIGEEKYDATSASMIALLKYGSGLPFNRLARLQGNLRIPLPAATQWDIVHAAARRIEPAYEELIREAAQGEVVHNDDTGMKILELMGKRWKKKQAKSKKKGKRTSKSKERSGVFTSGIISLGEHKVALFFTGRKHAGENLSDVLAKRAADLGAPIQMCDALSCNTSPDFETIVANCMAHGRRQFVDVAKSFPTECRRVLEDLGKVYRNDAKTQKDALTPEDRLAYHRKHSRPVMVQLLLWIRRELREKRIEPNSPLGSAIQYMKNHWWKLTRFYRIAGAPLDNNVVERSLKKAILHRKNSLFYKTENGARIGDLFMSLIASAELAGANPFEYLCALYRHADLIGEEPGDWMPWSYAARLKSLEAAQQANGN